MKNFPVVVEGGQTLANAVELGVTLLGETVGAELSADVLNDIGRDQLGMNLLSTIRLELTKRAQV